MDNDPLAHYYMIRFLSCLFAELFSFQLYGIQVLPPCIRGSNDV